ncbi:MAG: redox-regulated ATPase YchF [Candidatus Methanophagaceae archaeon]|nr:MAG: redox-regulated ATPase YchF [Methanophagales archaeon]
MITIALAGKPNSGKSTFFKAATLADVEIASYPFTTISPNVGVAYARVKCPCKEREVLEAVGGGGDGSGDGGDSGDGRDGRDGRDGGDGGDNGGGGGGGGGCGNCVDGVRFVPVGLLDVAGLVRGAHEGKGLGNEFLDELRQAEAIIQVVDASGGTDADGNVVERGTHDPYEDVLFFREELTEWVKGILSRNKRKLERKSELETGAGAGGGAKTARLLAEQLAGVGVTEEQVKIAILKSLVAGKPNLKSWDGDDLKDLAAQLVKQSKKMVLAANKADAAPEAEENIKKLKELCEIEGEGEVVPCSAEAELALRTAAKNGFVKYLPGDTDFEISPSASAEITEKQRRGLEKIRKLIQNFGGTDGGTDGSGTDGTGTGTGTGVQAIINRVVFDLLDYVVAYPVEDEHNFSDGSGRVLPDAFLLKKGSTARDLAYAIHSDIGRGFLYAIDARTKRRLGEKYTLRSGDILKVVYAR